MFKEGFSRINRVTVCTAKCVAFLACIFFVHPANAQTAPNCKILNGYAKDGQAIRFIADKTIDSTAEAKCVLGIQVNATYSYITIALTAKAGVQKIENSLVVQFTDQSSIIVPLTVIEEVNGPGMTGYHCSFVVLDKYVAPLKTKTVSTVIVQMDDTNFKSFDMKLNPNYLKDAVACLNLVSY